MYQNQKTKCKKQKIKKIYIRARSELRRRNGDCGGRDPSTTKVEEIQQLRGEREPATATLGARSGNLSQLWFSEVSTEGDGEGLPERSFAVEYLIGGGRSASS
ncbi:hypothetical protein TIFTF001_006843 [Ficus carica]|uniref:Uncharacterized protein n=1 Tax=Ficus carica TaxID=3494 RepID=A0AA88CZ30_FICCA|nr:hypothetical protein TIFTF001_006843 [Ficus carica]